MTFIAAVHVCLESDDNNGLSVQVPICVSVSVWIVPRT
jgi:hypothetical protein